MKTLVLMSGLLLIAGSVLQAQSAADTLHALFEQAWERSLRENPVWASTLGDPRYHALWPDLSEEAARNAHEADIALRRSVAAIPTAELGEEDRLNRELFLLNLDRGITGFAFGMRRVPMSHMGGIQTADQLAMRLRFETETDLAGWTERLKGFGKYVDQTLDLLRSGLAEGRTLPRVPAERVLKQIRAQKVDNPEKSRFFAPFRNRPAGVSEEPFNRLAASARSAIETVVLPAYARLGDFFERDYLPACSDTPGVWRYPDGASLYAHRVRASTTTDLTPDQVHEIGLGEVKRIRTEMDQVIARIGFSGSYREFLDHLKNSPERNFDTAENLLRDYRALAKKIDPLMTHLFRRLPRAPYAVEPVPASTAPDAPAAYYLQPAPDGSRPGTFYVNTHAPQTRPRYTAVALTLHEAVPGHHFQIAIAQELDNLPRFRRFGGYTAYVEGWGLYSEWLGLELGLYENPYDDFGRLSFELWRAARLVVDTGLHHKKWSRQQAIDYMKNLLPQSEDEIAAEVDRYSVWPGQALAYKIGQLKLLELRQLVERELGAKFDRRAFHDLVLEAGPLPLDVLEQRVRAWMATLR